jgi:hypothetical protein
MMSTLASRGVVVLSLLAAAVLGQNQGAVLGGDHSTYATCAKPDCPEIELGAYSNLISAYYGNGGQAGSVESSGDLVLMLDRPAPLVLRDLHGTAARYITCWPYSSRKGKNWTNASRTPSDDIVGPAPGPLLSPPKRRERNCTPPGMTTDPSECSTCDCGSVVVPHGSTANPPTVACECAVDVGGGSGDGGRGMSFPPGGVAENLSSNCTVVHKPQDGGGATLNSYYDLVGGVWTRREQFDIRHPDGTVVLYATVGTGSDAKVCAVRITDPMDNTVTLD